MWGGLYDSYLVWFDVDNENDVVAIPDLLHDRLNDQVKLDNTVSVDLVNVMFVLEMIHVVNK